MDCYGWSDCPNGECYLCDLWINQATGWLFVWLNVRRFFVRLWRRDMGAGHCLPAPAPRKEEDHE